MCSCACKYVSAVYRWAQASAIESIGVSAHCSNRNTVLSLKEKKLSVLVILGEYTWLQVRTKNYHKIKFHLASRIRWSRLWYLKIKHGKEEINRIHLTWQNATFQVEQSFCQKAAGWWSAVSWSVLACPDPWSKPLETMLLIEWEESWIAHFSPVKEKARRISERRMKKKKRNWGRRMGRWVCYLCKWSERRSIIIKDE